MCFCSKPVQSVIGISKIIVGADARCNIRNQTCFVVGIICLRNNLVLFLYNISRYTILLIICKIRAYSVRGIYIGYSAYKVITVICCYSELVVYGLSEISLCVIGI